MDFLHRPTRNLFFTGKGGVGKTTVACLSAVALADSEKKVLLVSTDPASNLDEVLGTALSQQPTPIAAVPNLWAMNIDPEAAARAYRERVVGPYRGVLPNAAIASMEEQFSGSCTLEIAAFDEFARLLGDTDTTVDFEHVLFDTAPTGHTLRLLSLPSAWEKFLASNTTGISCLGPLAGLQAQQQMYRTTVKSLADGETTTLILVTRAETTALREAERTSQELFALDVTNQWLVVNGLFTASDPSDMVAEAWERRTRESLRCLPNGLSALPRTSICLAPLSLIGIPALRSFLVGKESRPASAPHPQTEPMHKLGELIDDLAQAGRGVILTMGKGGVGKTTVAAAVAVALAERGFRVHLTTTDPAAHVAETVRDEVPNLRVSRIDPKTETADYAAHVLETAGVGLDPHGKLLLEEDLRSPCTEEVAVFRAFARVVAEGEEGFVVLDTAPTGHTILLLDAALAYHREIIRQASSTPQAVEQLLPRLRDPESSRILIVTLPEATPIHEAARLQADLERAGIRPFAWVVNQCLTPLEISDPLLRARQNQEAKYLREVMERHSSRTAGVAWQCETPRGAARLLRLVADPVNA